MWRLNITVSFGGDIQTVTLSALSRRLTCGLPGRSPLTPLHFGLYSPVRFCWTCQLGAPHCRPRLLQFVCGPGLLETSLVFASVSLGTYIRAQIQPPYCLVTLARDWDGEATDWAQVPRRVLPPSCGPQSAFMLSTVAARCQRSLRSSLGNRFS